MKSPLALLALVLSLSWVCSWAAEPLASAPELAELTRRLKHTDAGIREEAATRLGEVRDPGAVTALTAALNDRDQSVRYAAARALASHQSPRLIQSLAGKLKAPDRDKRLIAAVALARMNDPQSLDALLDLAEISDLPFRWELAQALGSAADEAMRDALLLALDRPDWRARETIVTAMSMFEHCVANMYFLPVALFVKAGAGPEFWSSIGSNPDAWPRLTWQNFLIANLVPVTIGNVIGGAVFVGGVYWLIYCRSAEKQP